MLNNEKDTLEWTLPAYFEIHDSVVNLEAWRHDGACCAIACMTTICKAMMEHHDVPGFAEMPFGMQAFVVVELVRRGIETTARETIEALLDDIAKREGGADGA